MTYPNPSAFRAALTHRAKESARIGTKTATELLQHFYLARLLARVFHHDPEGWVLKGGQALLVRYPGARHSRDVDLIYDKGDGPDLNEALAALRQAADLNLADHLRFEFLDFSEAIEDHAARTARFTIHIGTTKMHVLSVDLVVDHRPSSRPVARELPPYST